MPRALWFLIGLTCRAKLRNCYRSLVIPRRALFSLLGFSVTGAALFLPLGLQFNSEYWNWRINPTLVTEAFSSLLTFMLVMSLLVEPPGRALSFSPSEGDFLFPAPLTRRQLLIYKLVNGIGSALLGGCFIGLWLNPFSNLRLAPFAAGFLGLASLDFAQVMRQLLGEAFDEPRLKIAGRILRWLAGALLLVFLGIEIKAHLQRDFPATLHAVHTSLFGLLFFAPARLFANIATARFYSGAVYWTIPALLILAVLLRSIIYLDSISIRDFGEIEVQRAPKNTSHAGSKTEACWKPGWWNGIGPVFWKQTLVLQRKFSWFAYASILLITEGSFVLGRYITGEAPPIWAAIGLATIGLSSAFVMVTPFDFRSELDHLQNLKSLPLSATAVVLGEMLPLVLCGSIIVFLHLAAMAILLYGPRIELLGTAFVTPAWVFLLAGFENAAFLLFPIRLKPAKASGFQDAHRIFALMLAKTTVFTLFILLFVGCAWYLKMNGLSSNVLFFAAELIAVTASAVLMGCAVVKTYKNFDVAADVPE